MVRRMYDQEIETLKTMVKDKVLSFHDLLGSLEIVDDDDFVRLEKEFEKLPKTKPEDDDGA